MYVLCDVWHHVFRTIIQVFSLTYSLTYSFTLRAQPCELSLCTAFVSLSLLWILIVKNVHFRFIEVQSASESTFSNNNQIEIQKSIAKNVGVSCALQKMKAVRKATPNTMFVPFTLSLFLSRLLSFYWSFNSHVRFHTPFRQCSDGKLVLSKKIKEATKTKPSKMKSKNTVRTVSFIWCGVHVLDVISDINWENNDH